MLTGELDDYQDHVENAFLEAHDQTVGYLRIALLFQPNRAEYVLQDLEDEHVDVQIFVVKIVELVQRLRKTVYKVHQIFDENLAENSVHVEPAAVVWLLAVSAREDVEKLLEILWIGVRANLHEILKHLQDDDHVVLDHLVDLALVQLDYHLHVLTPQLHKVHREAVGVVLVIQLLGSVDRRLYSELVEELQVVLVDFVQKIEFVIAQALVNRRACWLQLT